jgi:hypothetical protein
MMQGAAIGGAVEKLAEAVSTMRKPKAVKKYGKITAPDGKVYTAEVSEVQE